MKRLPITTLGAFAKRKNGLYRHVNDRYLTDSLIKIIYDKIKIAKRAHICHSVPIDEIIGVLTDYNTINNASGAAGYCDWNNKVIAIADNSLITACHEIGHAIQYDIGLMDGYGSILSWHIKMERQCETIAYYLYNSIFGAKPASYGMFNAYTTKDSVLWLADWYKGAIDNDIIFRHDPG